MFINSYTIGDKLVIKLNKGHEVSSQSVTEAVMNVLKETRTVVAYVFGYEKESAVIEAPQKLGTEELERFMKESPPVGGRSRRSRQASREEMKGGE